MEPEVKTREEISINAIKDLITPDPGLLCDDLELQPFGRGLPTQEQLEVPETRYALGLIVRQGGKLSLEDLRGCLAEDKRISEYEALKAHLGLCHTEGWVHTELVKLDDHQSAEIYYEFSSRLHFWYVVSAINSIMLELT